MNSARCLGGCTLWACARPRRHPGVCQPVNSERQPPTLDDIAAALQQARAHHQHMVRILSAQVRIGRLAFPTDGEFATAGLALAEHQRILEVLSKALEVIHGR